MGAHEHTTGVAGHRAASAPASFASGILNNENLVTTAIVFIGVLASVMFMSTGIFEDQDIAYKWTAVSSWAHGQAPVFAFDHHNLRWGMHIIGVPWVALFGDSPASYLTLSYVVFSASTAALYWLARDMFPRGVAMLVLAAWLLNPITYLLPANYTTELFSQLYLVIGLLLLRIAYTRNSRVIYALAMLGFFFMYGAKETNIFFMPGLALWELMRRRFDNLAIMIGVFAVGGGIETTIVDWVGRGQHLMLGRAQALAGGKHMKEMGTIFANYTPGDILGRWVVGSAEFVERNSLYAIEIVSKPLFYLFFAFSAMFVALGLRRRAPDAPSGATLQAAGISSIVYAFTALGLSFAFCTTFFIISLNPLVLGQPLVDRYLWVLLVPAVLSLGAAILLLRQWLETSPALRGVPAKLAGAARSVLGMIERYAVILLVLVLLAGTGVRVVIDAAVVAKQRHGLAQPYTYLGANRYFETSIREPLLAGCTVMFASPSASVSGLIFGFPFGTFDSPSKMYLEQIDGLKTADGLIVRTQIVNVDDVPGLDGRLHTDGVRKVTAVRLENAPACGRSSYVGRLDVPAENQSLP